MKKLQSLNLKTMGIFIITFTGFPSLFPGIQPGIEDTTLTASLSQDGDKLVKTLALVTLPVVDILNSTKTIPCTLSLIASSGYLRNVLK